MASLSYGRVEQIQNSVKGLFKRLDPFLGNTYGLGICSFLKDWGPHSEERLWCVLDGWKHRLNTRADIVILFFVLSQALKRHHSLCRLFQLSYEQDPKEHLSHFCALLYAFHPETDDLRFLESPTSSWAGTGLRWFFCSPESGSTCKRFMMWLRWMVRQDRIDPGTWHHDALVDDTLPPPTPARLFYPVDTHIFQWAKATGVIKQGSTPTWTHVEQITRHFQNIDPEDPVRFDFAICHEGMKILRQKRSESTIDLSHG